MASRAEEKNTELEFTGERFMPEVDGQIAFEHLHRYHYAAQFCAGKQVLDVACGEGYGSQIISQVAVSVVGVDISADAITHATGRYGSERLLFVEASAANLPLDDASVDVVVSFETIEHHAQHEEMLSEIRRVLRPGGLLVMSSPNRQYYSIEPGYTNPYHVKELFREELISLVEKYFANQQVFSQRVVYGSLLVAEEQSRFDSIFSAGSKTSEWTQGLSRPLYDLVLVSDDALPEPRSSFFEMKVHGMDAGAFYGNYLPARIQQADKDIVQLCGQMSKLEDEIQQQARGRQDVLRDAEERISKAQEAHRVEVGHLRDRHHEILASLSALDAQVDGVRRECGDNWGVRDRRLEELFSVVEQNCVQFAEASNVQVSDIGEFRGQLEEVRRQLTEASDVQVSGIGEFKRQLEEVRRQFTEVSDVQVSGIGEFKGQLEEVRQQLAEASDVQVLGIGEFKGQLEEVRRQFTEASDVQVSGIGGLKEQLEEVRQQLAEVVAREEGILNLEGLLIRSQEMALSSSNNAEALREELARVVDQREAVKLEVQELQLVVNEQRLIVEHRENDINLMKQSRSWRYTRWLRKLSGSAGRRQ